MTAQLPGVSIITLSDVFSRLNMSELPAMSRHVQELITMTESYSASNADISRLILRDYSLTSRVLQAASSAYYNHGRPCHSITNAVAILGLNAIRDLALGMGVLDDFVKSGVDEETVVTIMTRSFLAGFLARRLGGEKKLKVEAEEAFLCGLFYNLGKMILCLYFPVSCRDIESMIESGMSEELACHEVLNGLTYREIGIEVAKFWNLPDALIFTMESREGEVFHNKPESSDQHLAELIYFSNTFVDFLCDGSDLEVLLQKYGATLSVGVEETLILMNQCVDEAKNMSIWLGAAMAKNKISTKIRHLEINSCRGILNSDTPGEQRMVASRVGRRKVELTEFLASLHVPDKREPGKTIHDFIHDIDKLLCGDFSLNEFYKLLLDAFHRGLGFDRAILATVNAFSAKVSLVGRLGAGDIDPEGVRKFEHLLAPESQCPITVALVQGKDMMIPVDKVSCLSGGLHNFVRGRNVYLFPIVIEGKDVSMIYLDRKAELPSLDKDKIKTVRLLREHAVSAISKIRAVS